MAGAKLISLVVLIMLVAGPMSAQAITCGQVQGALSPCLGYLKSGGVPSSGCCNGVRNINSQAKTTADRQLACNCLKSAAGAISGLNPANAESLPGKCNVNIPYKISLSTNCNNIK